MNKLVSIVLGILVSMQSCYSNDFDDETGNMSVRTEDVLLADSLPIVPQKAFYKDIFLDAGIGLTSRKFL